MSQAAQLIRLTRFSPFPLVSDSKQAWVLFISLINALVQNLPDCPVDRLPEACAATPSAKSSNQVWIEANRLQDCLLPPVADEDHISTIPVERSNLTLRRVKARQSGNEEGGQDEAVCLAAYSRVLRYGAFENLMASARRRRCHFGRQGYLKRCAESVVGSGPQATAV